MVTRNYCQLTQAGRRSPLAAREALGLPCQGSALPTVLVVTGCARASGSHVTLF